MPLFSIFTSSSANNTETRSERWARLRPRLTSQNGNAHQYIAFGLNLFYLVHTLSNLYDVGSAAVQTQHKGAVVQIVFQLALYVAMLGCLVLDLIVMSTSKLSIADWFWRPGVCLCLLLSADRTVEFLDYLMNIEYWLETCHRQQLGPLGSAALTNMLCELQVQVHSIHAFLLLARDLVISTLYAYVCGRHMKQWITVLKHKQEMQQQQRQDAYSAPGGMMLQSMSCQAQA
ncbi:hypothetical protein BC940DRAFT_291265 [Gongronella butleri]|nr:hypothetical protein BC940DRAFT_291265 [Gongronella butleri]